MNLLVGLNSYQQGWTNIPKRLSLSDLQNAEERIKQMCDRFGWVYPTITTSSLPSNKIKSSIEIGAYSADGKLDLFLLALTITKIQH